MKSLKLIFIGVLFIISGALKAQVSVNVNFGTPPMWGPIGYTEVRYYYLPDVEAYYDINTSMFIYYRRGEWIHRPTLPYPYIGYDLYSGYKVVMVGYSGEAPYYNFREYKRSYGRGYRKGVQQTVGQRPMKAHRNEMMHNGHSNDRFIQHNPGNSGQGNSNQPGRQKGKHK